MARLLIYRINTICEIQKYVIVFGIYYLNICIYTIFYIIQGALSQTRFSEAPESTAWHHLDESAQDTGSESVDVK